MSPRDAAAAMEQLRPLGAVPYAAEATAGDRGTPTGEGGDGLAVHDSHDSSDAGGDRVVAASHAGSDEGGMTLAEPVAGAHASVLDRPGPSLSDSDGVRGASPVVAPITVGDRLDRAPASGSATPEDVDVVIGPAAAGAGGRVEPGGRAAAADSRNMPSGDDATGWTPRPIPSPLPDGPRGTTPSRDPRPVGVMRRDLLLVGLVSLLVVGVGAAAGWSLLSEWRAAQSRTRAGTPRPSAPASAPPDAPSVAPAGTPTDAPTAAPSAAPPAGAPSAAPEGAGAFIGRFEGLARRTWVGARTPRATYPIIVTLDGAHGSAVSPQLKCRTSLTRRPSADPAVVEYAEKAERGSCPAGVWRFRAGAQHGIDGVLTTAAGDYVVRVPLGRVR